MCRSENVFAVDQAVTISIDSSALLGYYNSKEGILTGSTSSSGTSTSTSSTSSASSTSAVVPTPPWQSKSAASASTLASQVLAGQSIINTNANTVNLKGASSDYQSLFTLYQGLSALNGLATDMLNSSATSSTGDISSSTTANAFTKGLSQIESYVSDLSLQHIKLTTGTVQSSDSTTNAPTTQNTSYTTGVIFQGGLNDEVPAFQGDTQFSINVTEYNGTKIAVPIDLSQMGSTSRTMPNVVSYINSQLQSAGVETRFATDDQPGTPTTVKVGSQTVTLPAGPDQWSFKINASSDETVSFSAPATAPAVYVGQTSGDTTTYQAQLSAAASAASLAKLTGSSSASSSVTATTVSAPIQQILKLQADNASSSTTSPPAAVALPGTANAASDEAWAQTLNSNISSVDATATGSDGSLYVLANVTGTVDGETPQSTQNVALQKYDSAGNLVYSTILGSAGATSGLSLAVSSTGQVAVAGSVTGALTPTSQASASGAADSFVAVYNSQGEQQWTTTGTSPSNNQVNSVAFGSDGTLYVAGQNNAPSATTTNYASAAGYLAAYSTTGQSLFNVATGTSNANSVAVDGNTVVVAGTNNGDAVVNSYTTQSSGAPTLSATRDLGSLGSGSIAGVAINNGQVVVAGTTSNAALNAGTVTSAFSGTQDAFVAQLSENLTPSSSDAVAYYGGTGATSATALTVSNGQVYIAGSSSGGLPGVTNASGTQEGYVAAINVATGQTTWSQALAGQDGVDAPNTIAVASSGASVLDRLGLPTQSLQYQGSQLLTAATSVAAGDQFQIQVGAGTTPATVTISATDTPATLAQKIKQASGYQVNVSVVTTSGKQEIKITPEYSSQTIQLLPGAAGKDALGPLGLSAGIIQTAPAIAATPKVIPGVTSAASSSSTTTTTKNAYGLNIAQDFDLTTTAGVQAAQKAIKTAMQLVQAAYNGLATAGQTTKPAVTGTVPAYLSAELSNYQAGLSRLTGSTSTSSSSSSSGSSLGSALASMLA